MHMLLCKAINMEDFTDAQTHMPAHLLDVWHEVVWDAHWVLSHVTAGVCTHGVEVPRSREEQPLNVVVALLLLQKTPRL